ncbi:MAG: sigma-54-dependent transcriptional regulator [bacterium]
MDPKHILIVDDEQSVRTSIQKVLNKEGYITEVASSGNEAMKLLDQRLFDVVLSDLKMPDGDGIDLLRTVKKKQKNVEVILLTGYGSIEKAVDAMKEGAYDFITKPFKKAVILGIIERAIERQNLTQENKYLKAQLGTGKIYENIIGNSPALQDVLAMVDRVAPLTSTVLITGASGTGKELIARAIHNRSPRAQKRFVPINCAAIPENLIESELFGHVKGAFTGAMRDKNGLFKVADGGTIFLDEIVSVPLNLQVKLLRAIEQKEIMPVGSTNPQIIDARIVAATNKNLGREVDEGRFREDLYYRLNVVGINIPPLKERLQDIPELIRHFIKIYNAQLGKQIRDIDQQSLKTLMEYPWKGNVRELENAIERAMILCDSDILSIQHFNQITPQTDGSSQNLNGDLKSSVKTFEQNRILKALKATDNDKNKAAELLGLSLSSLYRKISELGIVLKE